jgi:hypothetical protein
MGAVPCMKHGFLGRGRGRKSFEKRHTVHSKEAPRARDASKRTVK